MKKYPLLLLPVVFLLTSCGDESEPVTPEQPVVADATPLFTEVPPATSGVGFTNRVVETDVFNYFSYEYAYNGGGVAIGDVNNDGLPDIYFTGNSTTDKLYLNKGNLTFEDVTATALPAVLETWHTGVSMNDVNGDGWLDIYVCRSGPAKNPADRANLFYLNKGDGTFSEEAASFGIADDGYSTQASFFDYDKDGDLDLYVMNHFADFKAQKLLFETKNLDINTAQTDRLYKNEGGKFTDATLESGVLSNACGLGLSVSDLNNDGWPDVYIANDYDEADFFYINQKDGTFKNELATRMKHISNFAMGTDAADFNNDGELDLVALDMAFADHIRSKRNMTSMSTEKFWGLVKIGKHYQYMANTLQMNAGNNTFVEIGQMAGIARTDWSWAPLLADFDNDGWKDLYVTNGYKHDIRDRDFQNRLEAEIEAKGTLTLEETMAMAPTSVVKNQLFANKGDLTFEDRTNDWGLEKAQNSNGAAYADLDNDGDLDLVVNNMEAVASVFENHASKNGNHSLRIQLKGPKGNTLATGAKVTIEMNGQKQVLEASNVRGYQSSVSPVLHFGLGKTTQINRLTVDWSDGKTTTLLNVKPDQLLTIHHDQAKDEEAEDPMLEIFFREITNQFPFQYQHLENEFNDFEKEVLLPHMQSRNGPFFTVGDVNGDGLDDLHISGSKGNAGSLLLQQADGKFRPSSDKTFAADKGSEDQSALFFDADGDGDKDLYVVSGGNEFSPGDAALADRLYLNDGTGNFTKSKNALEDLRSSGMTVVGNDFDNDGDIDLFVGGRVSPGHYPRSPESFLLVNEGGTFKNRTDELAPGLRQSGMISRAIFADFSGDGKTDLAFAGEWNTIQIYIQNAGKFENQTESLGLGQTKGLWFGLTAADVDNDGDLDLIAGNLGMNNKFKASKEKPFNIYAKDFDANGTWDIVLSKYQGDIHYPVRGLECTSEQMPFIAEKFPTFQQFAEADMSTLYSPEELNSALHLEVYTFQSMVLINEGNGFKSIPLPNEAQLSVLMDFELSDINGDGNIDIIAGGNLFDAEVETIRYDAGSGVVLQGDGTGHFSALPMKKTGLFIPGNVRNLNHMTISGRLVLLVANNRQSLAAFLSKHPLL